MWLYLCVDLMLWYKFLPYMGCLCTDAVVCATYGVFMYLGIFKMMLNPLTRGSHVIQKVSMYQKWIYYNQSKVVLKLFHKWKTGNC